MKKDDFDESILENEEEFKKRFRRIEQPAFIDEVVKKHKESKNRITIYLDADIIEHFKTEAENSSFGYQTLINQALREMIADNQKDNTAGDIVEILLKDKTALSKLKAELELV